MPGSLPLTSLGSVQRWLLIPTLLLFLPHIGLAQTPSPLQEWQYSSGIILQRLFEPQVPEWSTVLGVGGENKPIYDGAERYRIEAGPVINLRYKDIAFASVGEGLGVNILRGENYRAGIALGYDLGRKASEDLDYLHGLGDIGRAPVVKLFADYVISKGFPLVLRADLRQFIGGADGASGDIGAYMPLPGSSKKLFMFLGPSVSFADHLYLQKEFGVDPAQATASGYAQYQTHSGLSAAGVGFSATRFLTTHWLISFDSAVTHLLGSASESPIIQRKVQHAISFSVEHIG